MAKAGNGYTDDEGNEVGKYIGVLDIADTEEIEEEDDASK